MTEYRLLRVPLPVNIVRDVDEIVVSGRGGFDTRADLVKEAVEAFVAELKYGGPESAQEEPVSVSTPDARPPSALVARELKAAFSSLGRPPEAHVVEVGEADVREDYLFGLHNRDYPTLWAARRLADMTTAGLVPIADFHRRVADEAWLFGERLLAVESQTGQKLTALFPTNRTKPESSESAFLSFAVGTHSDGDGLRAQGPLYVWRLAQLVHSNGMLMVGLTPSAVTLLADLAELTVEAPHAPELAQTFFAHLRTAASVDWAGFGETLRVVAAGATRRDLVAAMSSAHPSWTEVVAATNAAGYIARNREWGLLAPRQVQGRYELTDFGEEMIDKHWGVEE